MLASGVLTDDELAELATLEAYFGSDGTEDFSAYRDDPVGFIGDILGTRLWHAQRCIARDLVDHPRVCARSGHKVGKTRLVAGIAQWWVHTRERGRVILTSAVDRQVKTQIWREVRATYLAAGGEARFGSKLPLDPSTGLLFGAERYIYGFTTRDAEAMAGYSGDELLVIIDEASGFPDSIYEAVQGNLAGGGRLLATGNPTTTSGWFFQAFTEKRHLWRQHVVDSRTTPNITGDEPPIPGLATAQYVADMLEEYGEDHPVFAVRVAGQPPLSGSRAVCPLVMVEAGRERYAESTPMPGHRLNLGVDVAREGEDDSTIYVRRGSHMYPSRIIHGFDNVELSAAVMDVVREHANAGDVGDMRPLVKVDVIGNGSGVVDTLRRQSTIQVVPVNVGRGSDVKRADGTPMYNKLRAEVWFSARHWLARDGAFPPDTKLEAELIAAVYDHDTDLRIRVESKDKMKERLGRSPDRADGFCLCTYEPPIADHATEDMSGFEGRSPVDLSSLARGGGLGVW